jgi:hypothetical protein
MGPQPSREAALAAAARCLAEARRVRDSLSVEEAARRAHHATGPSIRELERRIRSRRTPASSPRAA